jgi:hypothetical protein
MAPVGADMGATRASGSRSMHSDRVSLTHITDDPTMGQDKVLDFDVWQYVWQYIKSFLSIWQLSQFDLFCFAACFLQPVCFYKPHKT